MPGPSDATWHERGNVAIAVEETETGRSVSLFEYVEGDWHRGYTMPSYVAREYAKLFDEIFPEE